MREGVGRFLFFFVQTSRASCCVFEWIQMQGLLSGAQFRRFLCSSSFYPLTLFLILNGYKMKFTL